MSNTAIAQPTVAKLLAAKDVAEILNCSVRHVSRLVSTGTLQRVKVGALVRFRQSDLEKFLEGNKR